MFWANERLGQYGFFSFLLRGPDGTDGAFFVRGNQPPGPPDLTDWPSQLLSTGDEDEKFASESGEQ